MSDARCHQPRTKHRSTFPINYSAFRHQGTRPFRQPLTPHSNQIPRKNRTATFNRGGVAIREPASFIKVARSPAPVANRREVFVYKLLPQRSLPPLYENPRNQQFTVIKFNFNNALYHDSKRLVLLKSLVAGFIYKGDSLCIVHIITPQCSMVITHHITTLSPL